MTAGRSLLEDQSATNLFFVVPAAERAALGHAALDAMTSIAPVAPVAHQDFTVTFEPLYVVLILVFALWTTRSWPGIGCNAERSALGGNLQGISQLLKRLPFATELLRFVLILLVYRLCAYLCYLIWGGDASHALSNALFLVKIQHSLALGWVEKAAQDFAWHRPWLMVFLNRVYKHCHIPGGATFLVWLFITDRPLYRRWIIPFTV